MTYDANGNILSYNRNGANITGMPKAMDNLAYRYLPNSNKLDHADDAVPTANYLVDFDDQDTLNNKYDNTGNLISDVTARLSKIDWTVYGKIKSITKSTANSNINYYYDASGNRVVKDVMGSTGLVRTFYIRDAQGNTMGVYRSEGGNYYWDEQHLYGSSRTGIWNWDNAVPARPPVADASNPTVTDSLLLGSRNYELSNHLGNVLAVISDKKIGVANTTTPTLVDYYKAEVLRQNDYYPFGMQMPGRTFTVGSSYRYGFNGKENDNEVKNKEGTQQDYGMRIYDTRLGRFLSVDPITSKYPELTPYQFASNRPIDGIDIDGLEYVKFSESPIEWIYQFGQGFFKGEGGAYNLVDGLNRNANPIGIVAHGAYGAATGKDLITQTPVNRTTAFTDMVVNGVMLASGEKFLAGLTAESQLTKQSAFNRAALGKSTQSTAIRIKNVRITSSEAVNKTFTDQKMYAPYTKGSIVEFETPIKIDKIVRLSGPNNVEGSWFTTMDEIKGLTPAQIKDKLALKYEPTTLTPVTINEGTTLRIGTAAPVKAFDANGGGFQIERLSGAEPTYGKSVPLKK